MYVLIVPLILNKDNSRREIFARLRLCATADQEAGLACFPLLDHAVIATSKCTLRKYLQGTGSFIIA